MKKLFLPIGLGASALTASVLLSLGCDKKAQPAPASAPVPAPVATPSASDTLLKSKPEGAISITKAKATAKPGDKITISGEIGGRKVNTFNPTFSTFYIADPDAILNCNRKCGCCPTPWDYCCEPKEKIMASIALVQIKDSNTGKVETKPLKGWHGLKELSKVTVKGTVDKASTPGSLIVNLEGIFVQP